MVLVSHLYRFIYLKNKKVAGTSVESFFGKYCINQNDPYYYTEQTDEQVSIFGIIGKSDLEEVEKWARLLIDSNTNYFIARAKDKGTLLQVLINTKN